MSHEYDRTIIQGGSVIQGDVHHHHYKSREGDPDSNTLIAWLSALNFATVLRAHCNKRTPETGKWLLQLQDFQRWISDDDTDNRILWCKGNPGVGKTILWWAPIVIANNHSLLTN